MAKAKFDIAAIDFKTEAQKGLHAGVGAADLAIETVKEYIAEAQKKAQKRFEAAQKDAQKAITSAQKSVKGFEFQPQALRSQATTVVSSRVDELSKDAKARRTAIEKRVADAPDRGPEVRDRERRDRHRHLRAARQARREGRQADPQGDRRGGRPGSGQEDHGRDDHRQEGAGQEDRQEGTGQEDRRQVTL